MENKIISVKVDDEINNKIVRYCKMFKISKIDFINNCIIQSITNISLIYEPKYKKQHFVQVVVDNALYQTILEVSKRYNISTSEIIRICIKKYIKNNL